MRELPTGTVTFLFTDIEGSTRLLEELGADAYAEALAEHRRMVREAMERHGGVEVDTQGDAFFVAFADAASAVAAATEAQQLLAAGPIRIRIGLHTGTARLDGGGYVGSDVHLGARIAAAGHGGQVLLSGATRGLVANDVIDLGQHRLKDFDAPVSIYQVGGGRFPPLKTISNTNLPRPASTLVGRAREIGEVAALLGNGARLVTLTGPGGTGKTRLAIESATELVPRNRNGVFWVPLAEMTDPTLVMSEVAQTLGAKDSLADHVGGSEMLLLLDNFEQVVLAAPELGELLEACANLRLLVTSRERLRIAGEVEYVVPPLTDEEAIQLFVARAGVPADNVVAELCRRLDNLPLAVELAAARASVFSPAQILARLGQRLDMLKGGRDADARQQTLRATIEWSHELLSAHEKELFARLAVFHGGCTLEAAEQVAHADIDTLQSLVDKSLVRHSVDRFRMLETIREFAAERLEASGSVDILRASHAEHFLGLAQEAEPLLDSTLEIRERWCDLLERDHENLRAAMDHLEALGEYEKAMSLGAAINEFLDERGHQVEGQRRYLRLLERSPEPSVARAKTLNSAAKFSAVLGDLAAAWRQYEEALGLSRDFGLELGVTDSMWGLGYVATEQGNYAMAEPLLTEVVQRYGRLGTETLVAWATRSLAFCYERMGNHERSRELHELNLERARRLGDRPLQSATLSALSDFAFKEGRTRDAATLARESLALAASMGDLGMALSRLCMAASALAQLGKAAVAAELIGCATTLYEDIHAVEPWVVRTNEETLAVIRTYIDEQELAAATDHGRTLSLEAAAALGISALDDAIEGLA